MRKLFRVFAPLAILLTTVVVLESPAMASCNNSGPTSTCVSKNGNFALADWYMNVPPDYSSRCTAKLQLYVNGILQEQRSYTIDHQGVYTPNLSHNIATLPQSWKTIWSRLTVYTCWGQVHQAYDSAHESVYS
jgi:hypothetical protein